jgi:hypothetical protein
MIISALRMAAYCGALAYLPLWKALASSWTPAKTASPLTLENKNRPWISQGRFAACAERKSLSALPISQASP